MMQGKHSLSYLIKDMGVVVGMKEEARLFRRFFPHIPIALSNAHEEGAYKAVARLKQLGVKRMLSFGCAGGLSPDLKAGSVILAENIMVKEQGIYRSYQTDPLLNSYFDSSMILKGNLLHSSLIVPKAIEKRALFDETKSLAVDMESGIVAFSGLPFSVLRVICDDSQKDLPDAAFVSLVEGKIHFLPLLRSLLCKPLQIGSLLHLAKQAGRARAEMEAYLEKLYEEKLR